MTILTRRALAIAMVVLLLAGSSASARQVLEQVPDDTLVLLKVRNMAATSTKLGKILTDLGLAAMAPGLDNPLTMAQQKLNMTQGVKTDGDMAVLFRDPDKTGERPDKSMVVLIPVTDYAAFVSNFGGAKPEGAVTTVKMPHEGGDGFISQWGGYAALSPSKAVLENKPAGLLKIAGAVTNRELGERDVAIYANITALRPKMQGGLQQGRDQAMEAIAGMEGDEKLSKFQPVVKAAAAQVFTALEALVRDASAVTLSVNFGDEGINTAMLTEFQPDSYVGKHVAAIKNTDQPLLVGIPTGKYLFYGGQMNQPELAVELITDFSTPILKELDAIGPETKSAHDYVDALLAYFKATKTATMGMIAPAGMLGQESIIQFVSVSEGDAPVMKAAQQKMAKSQEELMKALGLPADAYSAIVTPNAKTVDGIAFDSLTTSMNANANDPMARQQQQIMAMVYGPGGMSMLMGEVSGRFVLTMGVSDEILSSTIATAKSGAAPLADNAVLKSVTSHLPGKRVAEFYIPLDQIVTTVASYAKAFGAPMNVNLQPDLPPIGVAIAAEASATRVEGYIPTQLVQQLVAAGMQAYMQMQGGKGGGGG